ncbi:MAG: ribonuclease HII [Candidatus Paceibacterota bacterium]|jgi:ribonuclease HII
MRLPNLKEERALFKKGFKYIAGIDEAGRGPLAGPVVAGIVVFDKQKLERWLKFNIKDSKKLSSAKRIKIKQIIKEEAIEVKTSLVSEKIIDKINIRQATLLAMKKCYQKLSTKVEFLLIDGRDTIEDLNINQKAIIGGDGKSIIIAAASIIAKETRDDIMRRLAKKYPKYSFEKHKGYGTKLHRKMIKKYGPCKIHRKSFKLL